MTIKNHGLRPSGLCLVVGRGEMGRTSSGPISGRSCAGNGRAALAGRCAALRARSHLVGAPEWRSEDSVVFQKRVRKYLSSSLHTLQAVLLDAHNYCCWFHLNSIEPSAGKGHSTRRARRAHASIPSTMGTRAIEERPPPDVRTALPAFSRQSVASLPRLNPTPEYADVANRGESGGEHSVAAPSRVCGHRDGGPLPTKGEEERDPPTTPSRRTALPKAHFDDLFNLPLMAKSNKRKAQDALPVLGASFIGVEMNSVLTSHRRAARALQSVPLFLPYFGSSIALSTFSKTPSTYGEAHCRSASEHALSACSAVRRSYEHYDLIVRAQIQNDS